LALWTSPVSHLPHQVIEGADVGKSFITGALFGLGQALCELVRGRKSAKEAVAYAVSWTAFVVGVVAGSNAILAFGLAISLSAVSLTMALLVLLATLGSL
jgi:uncharacterized membrane protein YoaK (UPF0700 family)